MSFNTTPRIFANQLRNLITRAPAGGTFHDIHLSEAVGGQSGDIHEKAHFTAITRDGRSFEITVERRT